MTPPTGASRALAEAVDALRCSDTASQVFDGDGRLVWVSDELRHLAGIPSDAVDADVGIGSRIDESDDDAWRSVLGEDALVAVREELGRRFAPDTRRAAMWTAPVTLRLADRRLSVGMIGVTLRDEDGTPAGTALVFSPTLPARVLALLTEGDEAMFARLADLTVPGRRPAAVLFADIAASAVLSRRLPTGAYFALIRAVTTAFDDLVVRHGGITGKHAGDGASAFFLAETIGGEARAAHAALATARALPGAVRHEVEHLAADGLPVVADEVRLNVGAHWGADLFIGQVVTGGRLEVTALGDEVNECARVEQAATDGQVLATKALLERLDDAGAAALDLPRHRMRYRLVAELAPETKAARDAGTLAVVDLAAL